MDAVATCDRVTTPRAVYWRSGVNSSGCTFDAYGLRRLGKSPRPASAERLTGRALSRLDKFKHSYPSCKEASPHSPEFPDLEIPPMWTVPPRFLRSRRALTAVLGAFTLAAVPAAHAEPRVIVISLDGATPRLVESFMKDGTLSRDRGLGLLEREGVSAERNVTINPSLTAPSHIAIATGSTAARNDVASNTFHLVASPFISTISGFGAPIGGYTHLGPAESPDPTAEPLWLALRAAGKRVVTATFPGGDGLDVRVPGLVGSPIIQSAAKRTVDLTIPFGTATSPFQKGFSLTAASFAP